MTQLKDEYDQLLEQIQSKQHDGLKLQQQFDELSLNTTTDTMASKRLNNVEILEKELEMTQEENKMLREANEKLVQKFVFNNC